MTLTEDRIRELELPINRAIYRLRQGVAESDITVEMLGREVDLAEVPAIVALAKAKATAGDAAYRAMTRKSALLYMSAGAALLMLMWWMTNGGSDMPHGRFYGRAIIGYVLGAGAFLYGLWRWIDPSYRE
ncbi:hypothetical protein [Novosphingobium cyanobacteriorum]|uniref:Uncharacterized protein n=1 Tax=Novosphingobium cyanobacteriorum TaxID=3024215 RepID=A0ABT6CP55_9SPHN|nr:hypothetical protein [Novosphingobium cyanobacteriorum]MDF8335698.1 hypothetical protein [Novosphingobium cyanobacteriorum]